MKNKNLIALYILIIFSAVTLFIVVSQRNTVERNNNQIEVIIEYSDVESLANNSDLTIDEWLSMFKDNGLQTVSLPELTLGSYMTEFGITYESYLDLKNRGNNIFSDIDGVKNYEDNSLIIYVYEKERAEFLDNALSFYEDLEYETIYGEDTNYIIINQDKTDVLEVETGDVFNDIDQNTGTRKTYYGTEALNLPVGYDEDKIEVIRSINLNVLLRPVNYALKAKDSWDLYLSEVAKYGIDSRMFFPYGEDLIGYSETDDCIEDVADYIMDNGLTFAMVETSEQRDHYELTGYDKLLPLIDDTRIIRVFNTWSFISNRYKYLDKYEGVEEITNSYYRAITERNIKTVYLRPFSSDNIRIVTDPLEYKDMFNTLEERIAKHGYTYGEATTFADFSVSTTMKILLSIEIIGFLIVLLNYLLLTIKLKYNLVLLGLGSILVVLAYYIAPNMSTSLSGLGAAITFSTLATTVFIKECLIKTQNSNLLKAVIFTVISGLIALVGGLYIGSLMSSVEYFLEFEYFRGVKISLILPILIVAFFTLVFYAKEVYAEKGNNFFVELKTTTKDFLNANIKVKYLIVLGVVGIAGLLYIARGSNTSNIEPLDIELMMRNFLENNFLARPRTKEFLIAFPLMTFATYFAGNKIFYQDKSENGIYIKYSYIILFAIVAAVGLSSITNTFSHIRTPIYISIWRTIYGLGLGVVIGLIYIGIFKFLIYLYKKIIVLINKYKGDILENN
ncbi:MAG: DUF5693 family protein [Lachnospirales bacterium]